VIVVSARDLDEIHPPTSTSIQLHKTKGFEIGEVIRALGVNLSALAPGWH
jgi:hypothetical protein